MQPSPFVSKVNIKRGRLPAPPGRLLRTAWPLLRALRSLLGTLRLFQSLQASLDMSKAFPKPPEKVMELGLVMILPVSLVMTFAVSLVMTFAVSLAVLGATMLLTGRSSSIFAGAVTSIFTSIPASVFTGPGRTVSVASAFLASVALLCEGRKNEQAAQGKDQQFGIHGSVVVVDKWNPPGMGELYGKRCGGWDFSAIGSRIDPTGPGESLYWKA